MSRGRSVNATAPVPALKRMARLIPGPVRAWLGPRARSLLRPVIPEGVSNHLALPGRSVATVDGQLVVVHDVVGVEPWKSSSQLAGRVQKVLEDLGVEFWSGQLRTARITKWAVRHDDYEAVIGALGSALAKESCYFRSDLEGAQPRLVEAGLSEAELSRPVDVFQYQRDHGGHVHRDYSLCQLYPWRPSERGTLRAPGRAGIVHEIDDSRPVVTTLFRTWDGSAQPRPGALATPDATEIDFEVDAVYMWVDDSDPAWRERRDAAFNAFGGRALPDDSTADFRFRDHGELRASLRSLETHAPWIRRIFLVTDQQRPVWLDPSSSRVTVVDHRDIIDAAALPTFSSHVIGSQLHHIPGLASRYVVMNDDILFNRPVSAADLFTPEGLLRVVLSRSRRPLIEPGKLTPLEHARANSARLIERDHGHRVTRLFAHVPIPQSIVVAREVEGHYAAEIAETLRHPFRSAQDYEVNSWLHLYRALFTGRAVEANHPFAYFNVGVPESRAQLEDLRSYAKAMFVCVNDSSAPGEVGPEWLSGWLERAFPRAADHEVVVADSVRSHRLATGK